jgi:hypothetical protein
MRKGVPLPVCLALLLGLGGCKPARFATHESDLLHSPPAELQGGQRAMWNDVQSRSFGMIELSEGLYAHGNQVCKVAQSTTIDNRAGTSSKVALLYCREPSGAWRIQPDTTCRPVETANAVSCREGDGAYFTMPAV